MAEKKELKVNENVDIVRYTGAVLAISEKFFDENGDYTPHFGRANAVLVFFNYFVDAVDLENYFADVDGEIDSDYLLANEECLNLFNKEVKRSYDYRLNFANAYQDAIDIVNTRKSSLGRIADMITKVVDDLMEKYQSILTEDGITKISQIAEDVTNGKLTEEAFLNSYAKSDRILEEIR